MVPGLAQSSRRMSSPLASLTGSERRETSSMAPGLVPSPRHPGGCRLLLASLTGSQRRGNFVHGARPLAVALSSLLECGHVLAHSLFFLVRPQGRPVHGLDRKLCLLAQHQHVGGHPSAGLRRSLVAHQDEWHELVPLLLNFPARRLHAPAQRPETSFYEPVAPQVVWCSPCLVYSEWGSTQVISRNGTPP